MGAGVISTFVGTGVAVASQYMGAKHFEKVVPVYMNLGLASLFVLVFPLGDPWNCCGIGHQLRGGDAVVDILGPPRSAS